MRGSTTRPGITHNEATEKPVARARGGMANESATRIPGPSIASDAEITQLTATATTMLGATANAIAAIDVATATPARKRIKPRMLPRNRRVTMREPNTRPTSWNGSAIAEAMPRPRSSRPNSCSYSNEASATKPINAVARNGRLHQMRRRLSIFCTVRQLSAYDGTVSSVAITSSLAPIACRSHRPRTGSVRRRASTAKIIVGITKTRNGRTPTEGVGEQAGRQRTDERTDGVGRAVGAEHPAAGVDRVVVGDQRVVRRVDHRLADRAAAAGDAQHDDPGGQAGQPAEERPGDRADDGQRHPAGTVGELGDRNLQRERGDRHQGHEAEDLGVVEVELVADVRQQDAEGRAIELVDCVETEQHDEREGCLATTDVA